MDALLQDILWRDHDPDVPGTCGTPGCSKAATTRCMECYQHQPLCRECTSERHRNLPLHWVEVWNGRYFKRTDLSALGLEIHLEHRGECCPHATLDTPARDFVIAHHNGVHQCKVRYCFCPTSPKPLSQLVRAGFFPPTVDRMETAFTLEVLDDYILDFDISKKSAQDYWRRLVRKTNGRFPDDVPDRYRQFMRAARVFRYLVMLKRSGIALGVVFPYRDPKSVVFPCLICPWPKVNLLRGWRDVPAFLRFLFRHVESMDGNYGMYHKLKAADIDDVPLTDGQGVFMGSQRLLELTEKWEDACNEHGRGLLTVLQEYLCNDFKVRRTQRVGKFKSKDISGIISAVCNHITFTFGATLNL
ncbi:hypothetical protein K466DRAFT_507802, partial [Polyporus arcularius HHB13444]